MIGESDGEFAARMHGCIAMTDERFSLETSLHHCRTGQTTDHELLSLVGLGRDKVAAHVQGVLGQTAMDAFRPIAATVDADKHAAEKTEDVGGVEGIGGRERTDVRIPNALSASPQGKIPSPEVVWGPHCC